MALRFVDVRVVLVLVVATTRAEDCCRDYCTKPTGDPGNLTFTGNYNSKHIQVVRDKFPLDCCTSSQSTVNTSWYKWDNVTSEWKKELVASQCSQEILRYPCENSQILLFHEADKYSDSGLYRCEVTDGLAALSRNFTVIVFECVRDQSDYLLMVKRPGPVLQVHLDQDFQQKCQVQFGCFQAAADDSHVWWSYKDADGAVNNISSEVKEHYHVHEAISEDKTTKTVTLNIFQVLEVDLHAEFTCTATKRKQSATFTITLQQPAGDRKVFIVPLCVTAGATVLLGLVLTGLWQLWRPTIEYKWIALFKKLPRRTDQEYDVMVVGGEDDDASDSVHIANTLREQLEKRNYHVYRLKEGKSEIQEMDDISKCVTVIFVIKDMKMSPDHYLGIVTDTHCNVVLIVPDSFKDSEWTKVSKDYAKVYSKIRGLYTTVRWPGGLADKTNRRCNNFWSKVQRSLPMVNVTAKKTKNGVTDDPLIHDQGNFPEYNNV